jgi:xylulokinase
LGGEARFAELDAEAERSAVGANGVRFHPHLAGATSPHWQESGRGPFTGLCLATTRGDLVRAVLEGVAFELKLNLSVLAELAGEPREVILFGGGARSRFWPQLLADVLGRPLAVAVLADAAALGAAMLAAVAVGMHSTLAEAQRAMAASPQWLEPDRQAASAYQDVYAEYLKAQGALLAER